MAASTLILNARVVNEGSEEELDVLIQGGKIAKIGRDLQSETADQVVDATGLHLIPGMIDDQVHFREPGLVHKGDFATESAAAVAGGITSYMEMPNSNPQTITVEALADKYSRADGRSWANYGFYFGATLNNLEEIKKIGDHSAAGLKIFMGDSTGNMLVDDEKVLRQIFEACPRIIVTHCENTPMIQANEELYTEQYGEEIAFSLHPLIRSREACIKSSDFAKQLARETDARLHILHLTTAEEANKMIVAPGGLSQLGEQKITAEVCVHHLFFSEERYDDLGSLIKCNPSIKARSDRDALREAVKQDRIACIATDHAPHTWDEKQNTYLKAPSGLPLVQHALPALFELVHEGVFDLPLVVSKTSHAVAKLYQIPERGYIREGYWADLVLVDLSANDSVADQVVYYKCGWTPFKNETFHSKVTHTWVNGHLAYQNTGSEKPQLLGKPCGKALDIQVTR